MIIQCQSCEKRFEVNDRDIPSSGRLVQCGYCSTQWLQMPIDTSVTTNKQKGSENLAIKDFEASNEKTYRFLGRQWVEVLPSGRLGILATKKISLELDKISGKKGLKKGIKTKKKSINPSEEYIQKRKVQKNYETKNGLGFFGYIFLSVIIFLSLIGIIETFKENIVTFFPEIDNQLKFIYESFANILMLIKDMLKQY